MVQEVHNDDEVDKNKSMRHQSKLTHWLEKQETVDIILDQEEQVKEDTDDIVEQRATEQEHARF